MAVRFCRCEGTGGKTLLRSTGVDLVIVLPPDLYESAGRNEVISAAIWLGVDIARTQRRRRPCRRRS